MFSWMRQKLLRSQSGNYAAALEKMVATSPSPAGSENGRHFACASGRENGRDFACASGSENGRQIACASGRESG